jgi:hypothetical protein
MNSTPPSAFMSCTGTTLLRTSRSTSRNLFTLHELRTGIQLRPTYHSMYMYVKKNILGTKTSKKGQRLGQTGTPPDVTNEHLHHGSPTIGGPLEWASSHVTLLVPRTSKWRLYFSRICERRPNIEEENKKTHHTSRQAKAINSALIEGLH